MSKNPVNLAISFLLEHFSHLWLWMWGYSHQVEGTLESFWPFFFLCLFALIWGVFAVRNDPSRSGKTVVTDPGLVRLILELALFATAAWMLIDLGYSLDPHGSSADWYWFTT